MVYNEYNTLNNLFLISYTDGLGLLIYYCKTVLIALNKHLHCTTFSYYAHRTCSLILYYGIIK